MHVRHRLLGFVVAAGLVFGVGAATGQSAAADGGGGEKPKLTVLTQNLYLGSSLDPALLATTPAQFVAAVAQIWGTVQFTDFEARATALADQISAANADVLALQEVSEWTVTRTATGRELAHIDFLDILLAELGERGLHYEEPVISQNAEIGPAPLAGFYGCVRPDIPDCVIQLSDRDVILVNAATPRLDVLSSKSGTYKAQLTFTPPGGQPVSFQRGWASIDASIDGQRFRFFNTHLEVGSAEVENSVRVQLAQAVELLARVLLSRPPVIVAGDFNSAADGTTTPTYRALTKVLNDTWVKVRSDPGYTCCQNETLTNFPSALDERIDLILWRGSLHAVAADTIGDTPFATIPPVQPIWPSDHAGVVATLQFD